MLRLCQHVISGHRLRRIANLGGVIYGDCGSNSHWADIRSSGATELRALSHLQPDESDIVLGLPVNVCAQLIDDVWQFESIEDEFDIPPGHVFALPPADFAVEAPHIATAERLFLMRNAHGFVVLSGPGNLRRLPVWDDEEQILAALQMPKFEGNTVESLTRAAFFELAEDFFGQRVRFISCENVRDENTLVCLVDELLDWLEVR